MCKTCKNNGYWFSLGDVANWIEHSSITMMLKNIDEDEKVKVNNVYVEGRNG